MTDDDKFHHLHSKIDELHTDLKEHIDEERDVFKTIHDRVSAVENDHNQIKSIWKFVRAVAIFIGAVLTVAWTDVKGWLTR